MAKIYVASPGSFKSYFVTEPYKNAKVYLTTIASKKLYISTQEFKPAKVYFTTPASKKVYFSIVEEGFRPPPPGGLVLPFCKIYLVTPGSKKLYFSTEELDITPEKPIQVEYPNICRYPEELERIRHKATLLIWDIVKDCLRSSIHKESYGKENLGGYNKAGILRLLLDYLSLIWIERDNDSKSGLVRTSDYYYSKYSINDILISLRKCDLNIKDILALFNLNSYSIQDDGWPNYFVINNILNPPTEEDMPTLKQYTDIFTLESIIAESNQSKYTISNAQTNFPLTKTLKYLTSFVINGSDYIGYVDYNYTSVTYSPSVLNGYTITNNDTVTITYWYEE